MIRSLQPILILYSQYSQLIFAYRFAPLLAYTISIYGAYFLCLRGSALLLVRVAWNAAVGELGIGTLNTTLVAKQSNLV